MMRVGIATDHGGFGLKEELVVHLRAAGHEGLIAQILIGLGEDYEGYKGIHQMGRK